MYKRPLVWFEQRLNLGLRKKIKINFAYITITTTSYVRYSDQHIKGDPRPQYTKIKVILGFISHKDQNMYLSLIELKHISHI